MIEKYVQADWKIEAIFDSPIKVANWQPEVYVPPEISEFVRNLKPDPSKFAYVHLIAMSDGDSYGSNMNGDIFTADQLTGTQTPEEAAKNPDSMQGICLPRYKTFEQAKFYKHHANGPMDPHYGDVPLAVWNDLMRRVELIVRIAKESIAELGMTSGADIAVKLDRRGYLTVSMGCVTDPDYPVLTSAGYKRIEDVKVGDLVFTHARRWRRVSALHRRRWSGRIRKFSFNGFPFPLEVTEDHPMWVRSFVPSKKLTQVCVNERNRKAEKGEAGDHLVKEGWSHVSHLGVGDRFFHQPVSPPPGTPGIEDTMMAALLGFYMAEGNLQYNKDRPSTVMFSCHVKDSLLRVVPDMLYAWNPDIRISFVPHQKSDFGMALRICNSHLAEIMEHFVGRGLRQKRIPWEIFGGSREAKLAFLAAWYCGDGFMDNKGVHWSTGKLELALQGRDLLASLGIPSSIYKIVHEAGRGFNFHETVEYTINVNHEDVPDLVPYAFGDLDIVVTYVKKGKRAPSLRPQRDGSYTYRIKAIEDREVEDLQTYNLEVEEDESYSLGGLVSHNCRISHEKCRYCGAENEFIHQRCDHLKNHINEIMPDGRQVAAENFGCRFFDLSDVTIPADPIAYTLNKVASAAQSTTPNPAFDVEQYGPWSAKLSEMEKRDVGGSTPVVRDSEYAIDCPYCGSTDTVPEFSDRELKEAASNATDLDSVLATATVAGIVFSPRELAFLTDHFEPGKAADFHGFGAIALDKFSPFIYHALRSKLAERSGYLAPCLRSGWEPTKIAEQGFDAVAKYYTYYRASLGSLPRSTFTKAAHHLVPELLGDGDVTRSTRVQGALYHLAYAGMSV